MAQFLALEWDRAEARVVAGSKRGRGAVIEQAFSIPLPAEPSGEERAAAEVGRAIAAALAGHGLARTDALVALGRGEIQLREFPLPAVADEELPAMVRLQAVQELSELDDKWLLDFLPIGPPGGSRTVLAAAIGPEQAARVRDVCDAAGLKLRRMVLRPCEAAWLLGRAAAEQDQPPRLLIDLAGDEADLTVVAGRQVVYLRTTRLSLGWAGQAFLSEIRRTVAAAEHRLGGGRIESVVFCGSDEPQAALARRVHDELGIPAELFNPLGELDLDPALLTEPPEHPGRFASLAGALLAELEEAPHAIDFLHPRRAPAPQGRRNRWIAAAVAIALAAMGWLAWGRIERASLNEQIWKLQADSKRLEDLAARSDKVRVAVAEISKWTDGEVVWLDQLRMLSEAFPGGRDAVVGKLAFGPPQGGGKGGKIDLHGGARSAEAIGQMEQRVGARSHGVLTRGSHDDPAQRPYSLQFDATVQVGREPSR